MADELVAWLREQVDADGETLREISSRGEPAAVTVWGLPVWSVERAVAEVAAKRRIIDRYEASEAAAGARTLDVQWLDVAQGRRDALLQAVHDLAAVYAGRPGWREEWAADEEGQHG